jgi:hypothetical protein
MLFVSVEAEVAVHLQHMQAVAVQVGFLLVGLLHQILALLVLVVLVV